MREKQFDVSNKASLHFAKLILTPIIICCRSGLVLPPPPNEVIGELGINDFKRSDN